MLLINLFINFIFFFIGFENLQKKKRLHIKTQLEGKKRPRMEAERISVWDNDDGDEEGDKHGKPTWLFYHAQCFSPRRPSEMDEKISGILIRAV